LTDINVRYCFCWGLAVSPCIARQAPSPAASLIAVVDKKPIAKIDDGSLLADVGRKAIAQVK
jgi:hypothetical protein